ncbi:MAG: hypothetical protein H6607_03760 [Flavobacteriales bacterium]|nr:hypothetical protein [Flavobacteriales bacterium]
MKYLLLSAFFFLGFVPSEQDKNLLSYKNCFDNELKEWVATFDNFNLSSFNVKDTVAFDGDYEQDSNYLKTFLDIYKPIITYSPDSTLFIDIYSYQLNLEKNGKYYYASPDIDQAILLFDNQKKYWNRIYFGTNSRWIDEVIWVSCNEFIMVGITKNLEDKKTPLILIGNVDKRTMLMYMTSDQNCFQTDTGYSSYKLKHINIKGL